MECPTILRLLIKGRLVLLPSFLVSTGWGLNRKGYVVYYSRRVRGNPPKRGKRAHVAVIERLLGHPVAEGKQIHHQDFDKLNNSPENLIYMDACFNPSHAKRCPYTGHYLNPADYVRRYGERVMEDVPEWVTRIELEELESA